MQPDRWPLYSYWTVLTEPLLLSSVFPLSVFVLSVLEY